MDLHSFIFWLLSSSLTGGVLAGIILLLQQLLKNILSATWRYLLWFLLVIKLLVPFIPESSWSIYNFIQLDYVEKCISQGFSYDSVSITKEILPDSESEMNVQDYYLSIYKNFFAEYLLISLWGIVSLLMFFQMLRLNSKTKHLIQQSTKIADKEILNLAETCKQRLRIDKSIELVTSSEISVPMVTGIKATKIILPQNVIHSLSLKDLQYILLHELSHVRRGDLFINWLLVSLQIMHWFNPFLWYAFYQMRQDRELACDADVLSCLSQKEYLSYGEAIIAFLALNPKPVHYDLSAHFTNNIAHLKQRVEQIAWYKKFTFKKNLLNAVLFSIVGCFVLTNATSVFSTEESKLKLSPAQTVIIEGLEPYFSGYDAAFVLYDIKNEQYKIYNESKSLKRVSPNSTYKIVSALIGLEVGAIPNEHTIFAYKGPEYPIDEWNQDQTLATALRYSVNWYFQSLNITVGENKIRDYLRLMNYGNCDMSGGLTNFWLENTLKISPLEQVELLTKFYLNKLPFSQENIAAVKRNIILESHGKTQLFGKTGTGSINNKNVNGWFVGYVEKEDNAYIFAVNIQGENHADGAHAKEVTMSILKKWNIL